MYRNDFIRNLSYKELLTHFHCLRISYTVDVLVVITYNVTIYN